MEPFHIDTLLQVAEILRLADDSAMSAQLIERVIYVMESVAHPLFNVTTGNSRLNFKQQENRFVSIHFFSISKKVLGKTRKKLFTWQVMAFYLVLPNSNFQFFLFKGSGGVICWWWWRLK